MDGDVGEARPEVKLRKRGTNTSRIGTALAATPSFNPGKGWTSRSR
jgi:hypothetical protein